MAVTLEPGNPFSVVGVDQRRIGPASEPREYREGDFSSFQDRKSETRSNKLFDQIGSDRVNCLFPELRVSYSLYSILFTSTFHILS
ncbi:hypothetical protein K1719_024923 [Acacia pycnantha]|nr:hypothetical protein K1719_024923 [Acacia pycnantha]